MPSFLPKSNRFSWIIAAVYGSPRIHAVLKARGLPCSRKRVVRLMQQLGLSAEHKRSRKPTTKSDSRARFAPNYRGREFAASEPNSKWVTDTKAVETAEGWLYLAVIVDLFSRLVVGWAMAATEDEQLVELALRMAVARRHPPTGLLHHSDRGSEFTSGRYLALLAELGIQASMSRTANCYDNAATESFFATLSHPSVRIGYASRRGKRRDQPFLSTWSAFITPSVSIRRYSMSVRLLLNKQMS